MKLTQYLLLLALICCNAVHCSSISKLIQEGFDFGYRLQGKAWDLSGLNINSLDGIVQLVQLYPRFDASGNPIFPIFINLNNNKLDDLDPLTSFPELAIVYAANNNLVAPNLDFISALINLDTLDLSGNLLSGGTKDSINALRPNLNLIIDRQRKTGEFATLITQKMAQQIKAGDYGSLQKTAQLLLQTNKQALQQISNALGSERVRIRSSLYNDLSELGEQYAIQTGKPISEIRNIVTTSLQLLERGF